MPKYKYIVLTNPVEGKADEYNKWYDNQHLGDVLAVPGFTSAKRYRAAPGKIASGDAKWEYLAIYEIETDDIEATLEAMVERGGTDKMPISPALDVANAHAVAYLAMDGSDG